MLTRRTVLTVAVIALAGCGEEVLEPVEETMTKEEASALFSELLAITIRGKNLVVVADEDSLVANCIDGGTFIQKKRRELGYFGDTLRIWSERVLTPQHCAFTAGETDFEITGDPRFQLDITWQMVGYGKSGHILGDVFGDIEWIIGERDGQCKLKAEMTVDLLDGPPNPEGKGTFKGKLCDHKVDAEIRLERAG